MPQMQNSVTSQVRGVPEAPPHPPEGVDLHLQGASDGLFQHEHPLCFSHGLEEAKNIKIEVHYQN